MTTKNSEQKTTHAEVPDKGDTLRRRALDDARGLVVREGCTFTAKAMKLWRVVRSMDGRTDQFDVRINGKLVDTCGRRKLRSTYKIFL